LQAIELIEQTVTKPSSAIYEVIGAHGGDVKVTAFSPSDTTLVSVIE